MKVNLKLDYCTLNFAAGLVDLNAIERCLCPDTDLKFHKIGLSENSPVVSPFGVSWLLNSGYDVRPHRVQISGVGCRHFEDNIPYLRNLAENHISRADFAFDVRMSKSEWIEFIKRVFVESLDQTRKAKKFVMSGSGEAMTIYIGSRKCAKYCRIYNKTLEDKDYVYFEDGKKVELGENEYVIRYELEFKRFKGKGQDFDPSPLVDSYFSDNQYFVLSYVIETWQQYSEEFMLPCPINELELVCNYDKGKFCSKQESDVEAKEKLFDAPRTFDNTIYYVADRFGKYIPFILANPMLRNMIMDKCYQYCGFKIDVIVGIEESGFYDLDKEPSAASPVIWEDAVEYIDIPIESEV